MLMSYVVNFSRKRLAVAEFLCHTIAHVYFLEEKNLKEKKRKKLITYPLALYLKSLMRYITYLLITCYGRFTYLSIMI